VQGAAEDDQRAGLAQALPGLAVQVQCLLGVTAGLVGLALVELDAGVVSVRPSSSR